MELLLCHLPIHRGRTKLIIHAQGGLQNGG